MAKSKKAVGRPKVEGQRKYIIIATDDHIEKMKDIAYWDRLNIKDVYAEAITDRIRKYEKKIGILKARPNKKRVDN